MVAKLVGCLEGILRGARKCRCNRGTGDKQRDCPHLLLQMCSRRSWKAHMQVGSNASMSSAGLLLARPPAG